MTCTGKAMFGSPTARSRSEDYRAKILFAIILAVIVAVFLLTSGVVDAQVLEIGSGGEVIRFEGPAVFTDGEVRPIRPASPEPKVRRALGAKAQDYRRAAAASALSLDLIAAVARRESAFRGDAISPRGARGEMQLMPATARALGVDPGDPAQNVWGGAAYLGRLMRRYDGDLIKALAAYNAGPAAVDRYGGVPPFPETQKYVAAVLDRLSESVVPLELAARR